ncbi:MAG TPA: ribonuclease Z [Bacteroidales bacterium]|jgi:ribonuclease Z|nr:ribonuclease Z [Bacteroidota bacterium]HJN06410.1 ribonuclease Z [Bacteroidales bacterium]|tara:strand:+ start:814 stop:1737 length:924 start_codon:yes stop_codon:yes gene_type:complete
MKYPSRFFVTILGNSSAVPSQNHHPISQLLVYENKYFLIDCGEGTQMQLIKYKIKYHKIDNIFISHMHGDHFFGLIGLISTYHLLGREKDLHIYGPETLKDIIENLLESAYTKPKYKLLFHSLSNDIGTIWEDEQFSVFSFPLNHRIPTWGFKFKEKTRKLLIKKSFVKEFKPSVEEILNIKNGEDYIDTEGKRIINETITHSPPKLLSYAYCSDTKYDESIIEHIKDVTLLYHEATFDNSMQDIADEKFHSTAQDAANIAKKANVGKLILGHFSARYNDLEKLREEAVSIFKSTFITKEGKQYIIS